MSARIVVVIQEDPRRSGRAVEALRIALGLGTGDNPMTVVLRDHAPLLLSTETDDIIDVEILEKHLPVFKEMKVPFVLQEGSRSRFPLDKDFQVRESPEAEIAATVAAADRVLVF